MRRGAIAGLVLLVGAAGCGGGDGEEPSVGKGRGGVKLERIGRFLKPLQVVQPPGDERRLFVVEQPGRVFIVEDGKKRREPFLDIRGKVSGGNERGLLSLAFAPDYQRSGLLYINFTDRRGANRIQELRRDGPTKADPDSARRVLYIKRPTPQHNAGLLLFGPDRRLYIGSGDGGEIGDPKNRAQARRTLLGKILRIDPRRRGKKRYEIPRDNPFKGRSGANEVWAFGLRNPWRFSFDRKTNALLIGDVGFNTQEEVDYVPSGGRGANFGWSAYEGTKRFRRRLRARGHVEPILTYGRKRGCAVTGGYVVRDRELSSLYGRYVYGDYCAGKLRSFVPSRPRAKDDRDVGPTVPLLTSFGEDNAGHLYATSQRGAVFRLVPR